MKMQFKEYAFNKFMAMNATIEVDMIVEPHGKYPYIIETAFDKYSFMTYVEAVEFAEKKYGVVQSEDEYYDELFLQDSDGHACLGGQI
jgi:hypothetical protein